MEIKRLTNGHKKDIVKLDKLQDNLAEFTTGRM